jgi:hypothetical protein
MTKEDLIKSFAENHNDVIVYVNSLTDQQFLYNYNEKWTAGQQLSHIYLTLIPFLKVLPSKDFILSKFGKIDRPTWNYETVIEKYLTTTLKAPSQYLPEKIILQQKATICTDLQAILKNISQLLDQYAEEEFDTFVLPHPLLGNLTIREMFYLMTYHPTHHLNQTKLNLKNYTE